MDLCPAVNRIPPKLREQLSQDPFYRQCAYRTKRIYLASGFPLWRNCKGRITWEHALLYAGKQVQETFAIIPLCWYHHLGDGLNKRINIQIALSRATPADLKRYPSQTWNLIHSKQEGQNKS